MALVPQQGLLKCTSLTYQALRFRGKLNLKRPKPPHFERASYIELTKPYFINKLKSKTSKDLCQKYDERKFEQGDNPLQKIIAQELNQRFFNSRLIAFYHLNPMTTDDQFKAYIAFKKENMFYKNYGKKTMEMAIKGTKFEPILEYYISRNMTVFSAEPEVKKLLKINKKFPQLVLLFAYFEGQLISKADVIKYSEIPNLQAAQAGLVQTLNSLGSNLVSNLTTHQNVLVSQLEQRAKMLGDDSQ